MQRLSTDVAIVGGGPGGLTAAHAVKAAAPHLKVCCYLPSWMISERGSGATATGTPERCIVNTLSIMHVVLLGC